MDKGNARDTMWILFLILSLPSTPGETRIDQFESYQACFWEQLRLHAEMQQSYPMDHDFQFECRFEKKLA